LVIRTTVVVLFGSYRKMFALKKKEYATLIVYMHIVIRTEEYGQKIDANLAWSKHTVRKD